MKDLVIGIDSSTQSTKSIAWNRQGKIIAEGRAPISLYNPQTNFFEQKSEEWWESCRISLKQISEQINPERIAGIAISNQRETVGFFDENMQEIRPAMVWLDQRSKEYVKKASNDLSEEFIHETTGRPVDITPIFYRLAWMKSQLPEEYKRIGYFCEVHAFLTWKLTGEKSTGWFSADPMGLFDIRKKRWSRELLDYLELDENSLFQPFPPGAEIGRITEDAAEQTGIPKETPLYAAGGDGQCAGLGVNCTTPNKAYINLGTALVFGVWNQECRNHKAWRTEIAAQGDGYIYESCVLSGTFLINWFVNQFFGDVPKDKAFFKNLEKQLEQIPIGSEGLFTLPYWANVMNPHWDLNASGIFLGMTGSHKPEHIYRSILEGLTLEQAQSLEFMEKEAGVNIEFFTAIGGGASSKIWTSMLADCTGKVVEIVDTIEASSLGAAMIAAKGAGWFSSIVEASDAMKSQVLRRIEPNLKKQEIWRDLLKIYKKIYKHNAKTFTEIAEFNLKHNIKHSK